jgi:hypothetical protein
VAQAAPRQPPSGSLEPQEPLCGKPCEVKLKLKTEGNKNKNKNNGTKTGHVANYVETEMISQFAGYHASFTQTRGSIPMYWGQYPDLRHGAPSTRLMHNCTIASVIRLHLLPVQSSVCTCYPSSPPFSLATFSEHVCLQGLQNLAGSACMTGVFDRT